MKPNYTKDLHALPAIKTTVTCNEVEANMQNYKVWTEQKFDKPTTFVTVKMLNGFEITKSCTCVSPEKYDETIGKEICLKRIENKVWELLGYEAMSWNAATKSLSAKQRAEVELQELSEKLDGLNKFLKSDKFWDMNDRNHKALLLNQRLVMKEYKEILEERLSLKWE